MGRKAKKTTSTSGTIMNIFTILSFSYVGKMILYAFLAGIAVLITAVAVGNDFDRFFMVIGIEVLAVTGIGWIVYLVLKKN